MQCFILCYLLDLNLSISKKKIIESALAENKGRYYYLLGKTWSVTHPVNDECINVLSKAVKLNPTLLEAWNALGECLVHLKRFSEAKFCFLASLKHVNEMDYFVFFKCFSINEFDFFIPG